MLCMREAVGGADRLVCDSNPRVRTALSAPGETMLQTSVAAELAEDLTRSLFSQAAVVHGKLAAALSAAQRPAV